MSKKKKKSDDSQHSSPSASFSSNYTGISDHFLFIGMLKTDT